VKRSSEAFGGVSVTEFLLCRRNRPSLGRNTSILAKGSELSELALKLGIQHYRGASLEKFLVQPVMRKEYKPRDLRNKKRCAKLRNKHTLHVDMSEFGPRRLWVFICKDHYKPISGETDLNGQCQKRINDSKLHSALDSHDEQVTFLSVFSHTS
jgi:hypothetical protein